MSRTVLEIKNLTVTIDLGSREVPIIDNLSLHIAQGDDALTQRGRLLLEAAQHARHGRLHLG